MCRRHTSQTAAHTTHHTQRSQEQGVEGGREQSSQPPLSPVFEKGGTHDLLFLMLLRFCRPRMKLLLLCSSQQAACSAAGSSQLDHMRALGLLYVLDSTESSHACTPLLTSHEDGVCHLTPLDVLGSTEGSHACAPLLTSHDDSACPAPEAPLGDCGPLLVGDAGVRRPSPVPACEWPVYTVWVGFTSRWCNHLHASAVICVPC